MSRAHHINGGGREGLAQDTFPGETSLAFKLAGGGLVVLSACAHAGIINTVLRAKEVTGEDRVRAILGGFHLSGAPPEKFRLLWSAWGSLIRK